MKIEEIQYLAHRFKRYLSSGCVLCWDICSSELSPGVGDRDKLHPVLPEKDERTHPLLKYLLKRCAKYWISSIFIYTFSSSTHQMNVLHLLMYGENYLSVAHDILF
jgi:hypothetical protein